MRPFLASLVLLGASCASAPAHAALWSSTNEVVKRGYYTTMTVSLTGDGQTAAAEVEIPMPYGVRVVSAAGRNGASCSVSTNPYIARVVWVDPATAPLPTVDTPMCDLYLRVSATASALWVPMQNAYCVNSYGVDYPCATDRGYLTITP